MSDDKKKYICKLPTNGYNPGDEAMLTDAEAANFNGGELSPRFVLAGEESVVDAPSADSTVSATAETEAPVAPEAASTMTAEASATGSYEPELQTETVTGTESPETVNTDVPPSTPEQGVE